MKNRQNMDDIYQNRRVDLLTGWYAERIWKVRVSSHNSRAKKLGVEGNLSYEGVVRIMQKHDYKCVHCQSLDFVSIDHITPLSKGGLNVDSNIQPLCKQCNLQKRHGKIDV